MRPPIRPVLANALRCRCPNCRQGSVFRGWPNRVWTRCPVCALPYYRESGYYLAGMIFTYIATAVVLLAAYLISLLLPDIKALSENEKFALWSIFAIFLTVLFVRPAYSLWLSLDFWIDPWHPGEQHH
jgi:uncharacterized protein (DUF983 family)